MKVQILVTVALTVVACSHVQNDAEIPPAMWPQVQDAWNVGLGAAQDSGAWQYKFADPDSAITQLDIDGSEFKFSTIDYTITLDTADGTGTVQGIGDASNPALQGAGNFIVGIHRVDTHWVADTGVGAVYFQGSL